MVGEQQRAGRAGCSGELGRRVAGEAVGQPAVRGVGRCRRRRAEAEAGGWRSDGRWVEAGSGAGWRESGGWREIEPSGWGAPAREATPRGAAWKITSACFFFRCPLGLLAME